ncbi:MAG: TatD family hydrolase [Bacteroides sp.]|nr:TatD family hydrolase [Bacteroides sp.]
MKIVDTHAHLFLEEFEEDLQEVVERATKAGVEEIYLPNIDFSTLEALLKVSSLYRGYFSPMIGLHPTSVGRDYKEQLTILEQFLEEKNSFVAIGEVGIDLYWDQTFKEEQIEAFRTQIGWSIRYSLPLVIHSRDSFPEVHHTLWPYREEPLTGIFHSFTGTAEDAEKLLQFGNFKLGINGVVTFKNSTLSTVLKDIPVERIVVETDAPYLAPVPFRGKRNESAYLVQILTRLSEIYGCSVEEMAEVTTRNAREIFKQPEKRREV